MSALDREKAREVLADLGYIDAGIYDIDGILDALGGCVTDEPPTIDRDAFVRLLDDLDEGDGGLDTDLLYRGVLDLMHRKPSVALTAEQVGRLLQWYDELNGPMHMDDEDRALAALLQSASADRVLALLRPDPRIAKLEALCAEAVELQEIEPPMILVQDVRAILRGGA